jgi:Mn-dependent DtxR family transcriptional regulator
MNITPRQQAVLRFIRDYREITGITPTLEVIAYWQGCTKATIAGHVLNLKDKGLVDREIRGPLLITKRGEKAAARRRLVLPVFGTVGANWIDWKW